jgi:hypothetical protein
VREKCSAVNSGVERGVKSVRLGSETYGKGICGGFVAAAGCKAAYHYCHCKEKSYDFFHESFFSFM